MYRTDCKRASVSYFNRWTRNDSYTDLPCVPYVSFPSGAELLESCLSETKKVGNDKYQMDNIQQSVSQDKDGVITITLVNTSLDGEENIEAVLMEETPKKAEGFILHGGLNDYNEFGKEPVLYEKPLDVQLTQRGVKFVVPACSVVTVRVY